MFNTLGSLLGRSLTKFGIYKELEAYQLLKEVRDILQTKPWTNVKPLTFKDGILVIEVPHYTLANEVRAEEEEIILKLKRKRFNTIKRIEVKVGSFRSTKKQSH